MNHVRMFVIILMVSAVATVYIQVAPGGEGNQMHEIL